jgi:ketosteroid isomerase-like protein
MSKQNIDLIKGLQPTDVDLVQLFGAESAVDALLADADAGAMSPDAVIDFVAAGPGLGNRELRGVEGLVEGWRDWLEGWDSYVLQLEEILDAGEYVVSLVRIRGRTTRDGVEVEHTPAAVWKIEDGIVVALTFYLDRDQAFEAAGLSDQKNDSG